MIRKTNEQTLGEVIKELLQAYRLDAKLDETEVVHLWEEVAGKLIARHTKNLYVHNRILYVSLDSAALRNELNMLRSKIQRAINKKIGKQVIEEVIFR
ncbi:MAG: DUF721 domain-containing protein [Bacteroidetes bacterium]|nr:DUF721 domain-containing protein [Bacteroidota bacterium]